MIRTLFLPILIVVFFTRCSQPEEKARIKAVAETEQTPAVAIEGKTIENRFNPPKGYSRKASPEKSFAHYLRNLPLKPAGTKVKYFNGAIKHSMVYDAVVDMDISKRDLQQCADAIMRLRGEYLFAQKRYNEISFTLFNGFKVDYSEWMKGNRVVLNGNKASWKNSAQPSNTYQTFRNYMEFIFSYASTISLAKSMKSKAISDLSIGDVFIVAGSPGHAVIVVDLAENAAGEKVFLLAQSYMPAQETQVLRNFADPGLSPWYKAAPGVLSTPEWKFNSSQLKTW